MAVTFSSVTAYPVGDRPRGVVAADLDGDGDLDIATAGSQADTVSVLRNTGEGRFAPAVAYPTGGQPLSIAAGDVDGDGDFDLVTTDVRSDTVSVLANDGNARFSLSAAHLVGSDPLSAAVADLDGDGGFTASPAMRPESHRPMSRPTAWSAPAGTDVCTAGPEQGDLTVACE